MIKLSKPFRAMAARGVALLVVGCTSFAYADGKDDVVAAAEKSFAAKSYSWVGKLTDEPEIHAITETNGLTSAVVTIDQKPQTVVLKDNTASAAKTDAGWKSIDEISHDPKQTALALWMVNWFKRQPAHNVNNWIAHVSTMTADGAGKYSGTYNVDEVTRVLGGKHKGTTVTDAHGTLTVTLKDGYIIEAERHVTGSVANSDGAKTVDWQESFSLSDYATAKPDVPDEAKQLVTK